MEEISIVDPDIPLVSTDDHVQLKTDETEENSVKQEDVGYGTADSLKPKTKDDVQRAIEGLKGIPDEELQEFLDDEDFMEGLDVVDAWEGEEERSGQGAEQRTTNQPKDKERRRGSRERGRNRDHRSPHNQDRVKREERRREESRRDPSKSTKDIERDKIRTKKDSESKILAEKEKAIKYLLDSDDVVPPGTEVEAIQTIAEKQNLERLMPRTRRSRDRRRTPARRRSTDRIRISPHHRRDPMILSPELRRSPLRLSPRRHTPIKLSPGSRRSPLRLLASVRRRSSIRLSPDRPRRISWEKKNSMERRWSAEKHRRRMEAHERDNRPSGRRSRSRERHRSRSLERHRKRYSRSPVPRRCSPGRRSRSLSRGRSPERRVRKRSPFINEITRQFRNEGLLPPPTANPGYMVPVLPPPLMGLQIYSHDQESTTPYMQQQSGPGPGAGMLMQPGFLSFEPVHQTVPSQINFEPVVPPRPMSQTEFTSGPVMYGQQMRSQLLPQPVPSPQPVPPPGSSPVIEQVSTMYKQHRVSQHQQIVSHKQEPGDQQSHTSQVCSTAPQSYKGDRRSTTPYNGSRPTHEDRLKTPEPPVISDTKRLFGKTSLSSLLEASVSAKDSTGLPVLYPGFKPEILRHCEHALRDLPTEDPRLKMKGRFFFNPKKEDATSAIDERSSNSILLRKGRNKIYWDEEEERHAQFTAKTGVHVHQKICQTDEVQTEVKSVQTKVTTADFGVQVYPYDLQQATKEEKRPIMDRLDWNMRETFDYAPKVREIDDLRWSLSNSSQKRPWGRAASPPTLDLRGPSGDGASGEYSSRSLNLGSPGRSREEFPSHRIPIREHFARDTFPPSFDDHQDDFHEKRSDRSRGESPMVIDDSPEELLLEEEPEPFPRGSEYRGRGKPMRGKPIPIFKGRGGGPRRKHLGGRPFRGGRGSFRGKF